MLDLGLNGRVLKIFPWFNNGNEDRKRRFLGSPTIISSTVYIEIATLREWICSIATNTLPWILGNAFD